MRLHLSLITLALTLAACQSAPPASAPLAERIAAARGEQPRLSARDTASRLGVSEAEVIAAGQHGAAVRLQDGGDAARRILRRALELGDVTAHTRNDHAVIERTGEAHQRTDAPPDAVGGYVGGAIDLRFDFPVWRHAFAVTSPPGRNGQVQRSLQFFDAQGALIFKLTTRDATRADVFERLVADLRQADPPPLALTPATPPAPPRADTEVDRAGLQAAWRDLDNVHRFGELLDRFGVTREQALRLAPEGAAEPLKPKALRQLLTGAAAQGVPLMAFVGNSGVTQIHSGPIHKTAVGGDWLLVLDPGLNLRLNEREIVRGWRVTRGGIVSVEFHDRQGRLVATFFGVRERGEPQTDAWRELAKGLPTATS